MQWWSGISREARVAAKAADQVLETEDERKPLLGLPMTVKEQFNIAGLETNWGNPEFKGWRPDADALAVARLKDCGRHYSRQKQCALHDGR